MRLWLPTTCCCSPATLCSITCALWCKCAAKLFIASLKAHHLYWHYVQSPNLHFNIAELDGIRLCTVSHKKDNTLAPFTFPTPPLFCGRTYTVEIKTRQQFGLFYSTGACPQRLLKSDAATSANTCAVALFCTGKYKSARGKQKLKIQPAYQPPLHSIA